MFAYDFGAGAPRTLILILLFVVFILFLFLLFLLVVFFLVHRVLQEAYNKRMTADENTTYLVSGFFSLGTFFLFIISHFL